MKVRTNRLFPYPILSVFNDSYKDNSFLSEIIFEYDSITAYFTFKYSINDAEILRLLKENDICLYFEIDCSETKYREIFKVELDEEMNFKKDIPLTKLNGNFEIVSLLITNKNISNYTNSNLNDIYSGDEIELPAFSIIGFTDTASYFINKKIDSNGDIPSIFQISFDEMNKIMSFEPDGDIVTIFLPKNEYEIYNEYKGKRRRLKQLMIDFPVLINLLDIIKEDNSFINKPWYNALENAFISKGYSDGFSSEYFKNEVSTKIAQDLLGNLIQDAFADFDQIGEE